MNDFIPLPPLEFQALVCGPNDTAQFEGVGRGLVGLLDREGMLKPGTDFLDVGCGCGRLARYLVPRSIGSYTGFDRHAGMVEWCAREIRDPRFRFDFFELKSVYAAWDQLAGALDVEDFTFPYAAEAFDACLLASVFTHMPPNEARHYLGELGRVTRRGGKILLSIFFSESGAVETHNDGVNVFHNPKEFLTDLNRSPFDASGPHLIVWIRAQLVRPDEALKASGSAPPSSCPLRSPGDVRDEALGEVEMSWPQNDEAMAQKPF